MKGVIHVTKPQDVPKIPHWAIFKFFSVSQSLYEENDSSVQGCRYEAYIKQSDWAAEIEHLEKDRGHDRDPYVAVRVGAPAKPVIHVVIEGGDEP